MAQFGPVLSIAFLALVLGLGGGTLGVASVGGATPGLDSLRQVVRAYPGRDAGKVKLYNNISWGLKNEGRHLDALAWADSALQLAEELGFAEGRAMMHNQKGILYRYLNDYAAAYEHSQQGLAIARQHELAGAEARCHNTLALLYQNMGQYPQALDHYQQSLQLARRLALKQGEALILTNIGNVYQKMGRLEDATAYQLQSLALLRTLGDTSGMAGAYHNLATTKEDPSTALVYLRRSVVLNRKNEDLEGLRVNYNSLGFRFLKLGRLDSAEHYLKAARQVALQQDHQPTEVILTNLSELYRKRGALDSALDASRQALRLTMAAQQLEEQALAVEEMYLNFAALNRYDSAFHYHRRYKALRDSLFNEGKSREIGRLEAQMDFERERQEMEQAQQAQAEALRRQRLRLSGAAGLAGVFLLAALVLYRARKKIKQGAEVMRTQKLEIENQRNTLRTALEQLEATQAQLIEAEKMAALGQMVAGVAHEINTPVGVGITASSHVHRATEEMVEAFNQGKLSKSRFQAYLQDVYDSSSIVMDNLERTAGLVRSFKQVSVDQITEQARRFRLGAYLRDVLTSLMPEARHLHLSFDINCPQELEVYSYPGVYAQIVTNLFTNAVHHGFRGRSEGHLAIQAEVRTGQLHLCFRDNGRGMVESVRAKAFEPFFTTDKQKGTGLGLYIVYNLVTQKLKGAIELHAPEASGGEGLEIRLRLPLREPHEICGTTDRSS